MLSLRPGCEHCGTDLPLDSERARICSFECTVSRCALRASIASWRRLAAHAEAQSSGRFEWYRSYRSDVARVDRTATFEHRD